MFAHLPKSIESFDHWLTLSKILCYAVFYISQSHGYKVRGVLAPEKYFSLVFIVNDLRICIIKIKLGFFHFRDQFLYAQNSLHSLLQKRRSIFFHFFDSQL